MRFAFWRRREAPAPQPSDEAREAMRQAERGLIDAERLDCAAQDVADRLSRTWERNHFAEAIARRMRGA